MHKYLRSVGFSHMESPQMLENLLQDVEKNYDEKNIVENNAHCLRVEFSKDYGYDCGITVCGEYDSAGNFFREYYYPYYRGQGGFPINKSDLLLERHSDKESLGGAYDDYSIGITLIFYLINMIDYLKLGDHPLESGMSRSLAFSALSDNGKILFPIQKSKTEKEEKVRIADKKKASILPEEKKDSMAFEEFSFDDHNSYAFLSKRMKNEDLYSIVSSTFMPCGIECDQYSILGDIVDVNITRNSNTDERLYQLRVVALNIPVDICINERDLLGIPEPGMRFKGRIWLLGTVE